jgi:LPXTG-motif cell wall-anchored protein
VAHCCIGTADSILEGVLRAMGRFVLFTGLLLAGSVPSARLAGADASGLDVRLVADRPIVTIDLDAPADQPLVYEVIVSNAGASAAPGVVVEVQLPGGALVRDAGDVAPGSEWRAVLETTVPASSAGGPVESVAVARTADGREVSSLPTRIDVQVISSAVIDRDAPAPAPAPTTTTVAPRPPTTATTAPESHVLGAMYERPLDAELPRTGAPIGALVVAGAALVLLGAGLVRRTADRL